MKAKRLLLLTDVAGVLDKDKKLIEDLTVEFGTEAAMKAAGRLRLEGKEYVVQDGDVMHFRFNV